MFGGWLFPSLRGVLAERFREHKVTKNERKEAKLKRKISRLDVKLAKMDYLATKCQYKCQSGMPWRQKKCARKAQRLMRKVVKLNQVPGASDNKSLFFDQQELQTTGSLVKDELGDDIFLPPAYEDICYQQPPPYEEEKSKMNSSLYPILM